LVAVTGLDAARREQRDHPNIKVKGELHVMLNIEDTSTTPVAEATVWVADAVAVAEAAAAMPIVAAEAE
jgi:hypothetical protein